MAFIDYFPRHSEFLEAQQWFRDLTPEDKTVPNLKGWISDLRSGNYQQGKEMLWGREEDTFCCLGVYLYGQCGAQKTGGSALMVDYEDETFSLTDLIGVDRGKGYEYLLIPSLLQDLLSTLNDRGATFEEIANFLEGECTEA